MKANKITTFLVALIASVSLLSCSGDNKKIQKITELAGKFTKEEVYQYSSRFGVSFTSNNATPENFCNFFKEEYEKYKAAKSNVKKATKQGYFMKYDNASKHTSGISNEETKKKVEDLFKALKELYKQ